MLSVPGFLVSLAVLWCLRTLVGLSLILMNDNFASDRVVEISSGVVNLVVTLGTVGFAIYWLFS